MRLVQCRIVGLIIIVLFSSTLKGVSSEQPSPPHNIDEVRNMAMQYSGLSFHNSSGRDGPVASVDMISYIDTTTPYIHATVNGRRAWRVTLEDVVLRSVNTDSAFAYARPQRIEIVIDSLTGQLLTIRGKGKKMVRTSDVLPLCNASDAERALEMSHEKYVGFAREIPKLSLWDVVKPSTSMVIAGAEEFDAHLIMYQGWRDKQPRMAWLIQLRGLPPDDRHADVAPEELRRFLRFIIDADTGKQLMHCNHPQYTPWKEE